MLNVTIDIVEGEVVVNVCVIKYILTNLLFFFCTFDTQTGSHITPEKTVIVQWDSGNRSNYRVGYQNAYDLRILDNGQIGIIHYGITCSYCETRSSNTTTNTNTIANGINGGTSYITGIRWKCTNCNDINLCSKCYHSDRHNLSHYFVRLDAPNFPEVSVNSRSTSNVKLNMKGIFINSKVIRGYDWDWENQDGMYCNTCCCFLIAFIFIYSFNSYLLFTFYLLTPLHLPHCIYPFTFNLH